MKRLFFACMTVAATLTANGQGAGVALKERAMQAKTVAEVMSILGVQDPQPGKSILLEVPDIVVAGKKVPVKVTSKIAGTDWIAVLAVRAATPLQFTEDFTPGIDHAIEISVDLSRTSRVQAIVRASGKYYQVSREVKIASPGCDKK